MPILSMYLTKNKPEVIFTLCIGKNAIFAVKIVTVDLRHFSVYYGSTVDFSLNEI